MVSNATLVSVFFRGGGAGTGLVGNAGKQTLVTGQRTRSKLIPWYNGSCHKRAEN